MGESLSSSLVNKQPDISQPVVNTTSVSISSTFTKNDTVETYHLSETSNSTEINIVYHTSALENGEDYLSSFSDAERDKMTMSEKLMFGNIELAYSDLDYIDLSEEEIEEKKLELLELSKEAEDLFYRRSDDYEMPDFSPYDLMSDERYNNRTAMGMIESEEYAKAGVFQEHLDIIDGELSVLEANGGSEVAKSVLLQEKESVLQERETFLKELDEALETRSPF